MIYGKMKTLVVFYEDLMDLKSLIPAILYKDSSSANVEAPKDVIEDVEDDISAIDEIEVEAPVEIEEEPDEDANIPTCINREMIDNAAVEFCMSLNTKKNRLKLVKTLFGVHRNRQDLFPFYARLVATLSPCMPEVSIGLGQYLKQEFRWQLRKKDQMKIESKLKVVRFIGELVKFKMFPKSVMSSDSRYSMMIENAFYTVCPPENTASNTQVKLPPLHAYIRKLIFNDFNETNASRILKQIRKINWNSEEEADYAIQCLSQVWNLKFYNIRNFAGLLAGLVSYHDWIAPRIIDGVLENIRVGMEINDSKYNQRRLAVITFLDPPDHMFRIRLVCTLLDTCGPYFTSLSSKKKLDYFFSYFQRYYWKKRSYYEDDLAFPFFIKNLIIETLPSVRPDTKLYQNYEEACAAVDKIEKDMVNFVKEKAPDFAKEYLGVVVEETSVGPTGLVSISEEQEYEDKAKDTKHNRGENSVIDDDDLDDMIDEEEDETGSRDSQDEEEEDFSQLPEEMSQEEEDDEEDIDDEDFDDDEDNEEKFIKDEEIIPINGKPELVKCEDDDDFVNMFDRMLNENLNENRSNRVQQCNLTVPLQMKQNRFKSFDPSKPVEVEGRKNCSIFNSDLARNLQRQEEAARREKEKVKQLTLQINERQEEEDMNELIDSMPRPMVPGFLKDNNSNRRGGKFSHQKAPLTH
ncbi:UPF2 [Lepeophtheirus salmonis]|uniref:UPF2 n=1 Tax=Lepeophtheirus salmonis TaxID=72036 RepID=A0A7R8CT60_LEPSM|nr:UPF2 [Lepeophtheirus salmonis]CAF2923471.1 UPF2 [Lepeophtheirus salmonis]